MDVLANEIGERIVERRKKLRVTQEYITNKTGISTQQLSNLENCHSVPNVETLMKLAAGMNVTPDYFCLGLVRDVDDPKLDEIAQKSILCTDYERKLISDFISMLIKSRPE